MRDRAWRRHIRERFILWRIRKYNLRSYWYRLYEDANGYRVDDPVLADYKYKINPFKSTLSLPFIDDFSYDSHQVDNDLWMESSVFVNRTYPINPPTIGVATFDGLDANGFARDFSPSTSSEPSDTLLSQTIDLSGISSAYFMFYYQAKGMGDAPQQLDKLVLEFFIKVTECNFLLGLAKIV